MSLTPPLMLIQAAIASVWLYEGLWCKVLGKEPNQLRVVEAVPFFTPQIVPLFLKALGVVECALAVWVLSGWQLGLAALVQTVLLVGMNANGILFSRHVIHDPAGMVVKNFVFVVLMWVAAGQSSSSLLG